MKLKIIAIKYWVKDQKADILLHF